MIEALVKDVRFALRGLRKQPAFTVAAVTALALRATRVDPMVVLRSE